MVGGQRRRALKHYQRDFYAHSAAASKAVNNDTNDAPQHTRDVQQHKHSSFETGQSGRLNVSSTYYTVPNSPGKRRRGDSEVLLETTEFNFTTLDDFPDNLQNDTPEFVEFVRQKRTVVHGEALRLWESDANLFLEEFLRLEGQGDYSQDICVCGEEAAIYHCQDCHGSEMFCHLCMVRVHARQPFHKMERWDGISFDDITSKSMGIRLQLGHTSGVCCDNPLPAFNDDFVIIHYNGIYEVGLDFCGCASGQPHIVQLLRVRLFPATTVDPKTAATFRALEYFQMLSFESKVSTFEFYKTAARLTDNTGIHVPKDRYESMLRMMREWRFIKQMQRAGQGHHPKGIAATEPGACAVLCPACPHVGKNLPDGWENAPSEIRFLYALFLGIDANFRLARRNVSSATADPGLNHGYAFFVEEHAYKSFISKSIILFVLGTKYNSVQISSCSSHNAVNLADTRVSRGLAATGAGTIDCARHNFKRPCSIGDLQKGERYLNMDYLFFSSMRSSSDIVALNISYDIACQWSKHIWTRMSAFPHQYHIKHHEKSIVFLVPKFHLPAHIAKCQTSFSFNLIKGVGRTDGEAPERGWADINSIATSTREMGPGSRRDTLDDHFNDWNWKKICAMGLIFRRKYNFTLIEVQERVNDLTNFEASLATDELAEWRKDIEAWEEDRSRPNPFEDRATTTMTQAAVRLALSTAEATEIERGNDVSLHDDISPSVLISSELELEDQQRRLEFDAKVVGQHATDVQKGKLLQRVNALHRRIDTWGRVQLLYMPGVSRLRSPDDVATEAKVHNINLFLPSSLPHRVLCDDRLLKHEWELREAQAYDTLNDLCTVLNLRYHLYKYKDTFIRGQRANTRANGIINNAECRIDALSLKYSTSRSALLNLASRLGKNDNWERSLKPLDKQKDVVPLKHDDGRTMGQQSISWIWKTSGSNSNELGLQDSLRVEWCKARARAHRWEEEVQLLHEEMRRVIAFLDWHAGWWDTQGSRRTFSSLQAGEGALAYAQRQANLR
ncbi:uncharacterized protein F5891DRAFT_947152 [Suillus fuscotomentosus]|uniref:CxC2-like cysteine cluster KDZ transposase-associated domain-containing protein n=1 Tax=Suillus fuscotomentosus TaxID=1912939 RepID=A0AAD4EF17_9AGAM|nr:uncharacterized protein F5891DRAFT_947152 [Suillus fuscotomentosus]KAG1903738.1 hypothetical protein F5891DRAFT_947152 [Suillus fuscotomentosus]